MSKKFFDYFPPPRFLELPYIGINITPRAVRFIEIVRAKEGFRVGQFAEKKLTSYNPAISLKENKEVAAVLRELREEYDLKFVEAALPEEKAYLFKMQIPDDSQSEKDIRDHIEFHLEENVPISLEEAIFDYHVIEKEMDKKKKTREATVSVLPKQVVSDYIEIFNKAGLTPVSFLIESQAIAKAVIKKGDKGTYLIVHINDTKTEVAIVSEDAVQFTSTLAVGADDFTAAIVKQFNITSDEAKKLKQEKGFVKDKENKDLFFALISVASALKDEIERVYIYWHTHIEKGDPQNPQEARGKIKKILLSGRDAAIVGFREYIGESVRLEAEVANVWANGFSFDDYIPPIAYVDALDYGTVIGLALPKL